MEWGGGGGGERGGGGGGFICYVRPHTATAPTRLTVPAAQQGQRGLMGQGDIGTDKWEEASSSTESRRQ